MGFVYKLSYNAYSRKRVKIYKCSSGVCNHLSSSFRRKLGVDVKLRYPWRVVPCYVHGMVSSLLDVKGKSRLQIALSCCHSVKDFPEKTGRRERFPDITALSVKLTQPSKPSATWYINLWKVYINLWSISISHWYKQVDAKNWYFCTPVFPRNLPETFSWMELSGHAFYLPVYRTFWTPTARVWRYQPLIVTVALNLIDTCQSQNNLSRVT